MKNLKKVLALGLALVMLLGMFTIASAAETKKSAAEFTDWDKVEHKDAVALCVDLGIINGLPDGSFAPDQTIDRASWAKLVYFTATGDDNADAYLGTNTGMKDIKGNWAESYINYLIANKYVSGDGLGNYMPTGTVTVAAGAKTMLTVLGWDAEDRGYQNDAAWAGNIITDAKRNGLLDDIDRKNTAMVNLTRDNAAQLIYNALQAQTVEAEQGRDNGEKYVTKHNPTGKTLALEVFDVKPITVSVGEGGALSVADANGVTGTVKFGDLKAPASMLGESATVFVKVKGTAFDSMVSTMVAKAASSATKTITDGVTYGDIVAENKDKKDHFVATTDWADVKVFVDGAEKTGSDKPATTDVVKGGNVVDVYSADDKVTMIKVTTYTVKKAGGAPETRTYKDKQQVRVADVIGWTNVDDVDGYQGLAEGDVVLVNVSDGFTTIEKTDVVTGKVTRKSGSKVTVNGTQYAQSGIATTLSGNNPDLASWKTSEWKDNEYNFFLDKNGDVCVVDQISGEVTKEMAYVLEAKFLTNTGSWNSNDSIQANLLFTDGTTQIVTIAEIDEDDEFTAQSEADAIVGKLVEFSVNNKGNYVLTSKSAATATSTATIAQKPAFDGTNTADSKTVFLVEKVARKEGGSKDGDAAYFVYTGYKNVPEMTAAEMTVLKNDDNTVVTYAFISTTKFKGDSVEGLIFVKSASYDEDLDGNYVYEIVDADGNETTMALDSKTVTQGLKTITSTDEKGVATVADVAAGTSTITHATAPVFGSGIVTLNGTAYATDGDTVCVVIDMEGTAMATAEFTTAAGVTVGSFKSDEGYTYDTWMLVDGTDAQFIYIIRYTPAAA